MGTRYNQKTLTAAQRKAFVNAVIGVKKKKSVLHPNDHTYSRYDDFVEVHLNAMLTMMNNEQSWGHQAAAFGPWHRVLLQQFELELQQIDPSVTIPYWDWTDSDIGELWGADFLGGNGDATDKVTTGRFAEAGGEWPIVVKDAPGDPGSLRRQWGKQTKNLPTIATQSNVMAFDVYDLAPWEDSLRDPTNSSEWAAFRPQLEIRLHNVVHNWVGGNMMDMSSPNDPVFWLHHCNIDRLWATWQRGTNHSYLPVSGGPQGHNLNDPMIFHSPGAPAPWGGAQTPASVLDTRALSIAYDTDPVPNARELATASDLNARRKKSTLARFASADQIPALKD